MKIGMLTFHIAHNYGAVLQCYALQEILKSLGHQVQVVNYQQPYILGQFKPRRLIGIRSFIKAMQKGNVKEYFYIGLLPYIKKHHFETFRKHFLDETTACYHVDDIPPCQLYVVGSDQPWNPDLTGGADSIYWGQFKRPEDSKLVTYAMSGSPESIGKVGAEQILKYCKTFDCLSFRETKLTEWFSSLTEQTCVTSLDPTLLATADIWSPMLDEKWSGRKYVLLYHVGGPQNIIKSMTEQAKMLAEAEEVELIDASRYLYSPSDFVSLIKYARYVITASFHAMVFSIIFHKPFVVVKTGQASDVRFHNLLSELSVEKVCLKSSDEITIPEDLDYQQIEKCLQVMRRDSMDYIRHITKS